MSMDAAPSMISGPDWNPEAEEAGPESEWGNSCEGFGEGLSLDTAFLNTTSPLVTLQLVDGGVDDWQCSPDLGHLSPAGPGRWVGTWPLPATIIRPEESYFLIRTKGTINSLHMGLAQPPGPCSRLTY